MTALPTWPIAGGSLIAGFAVADVTGVRPLGGIVLAGAAVWLWLRWRRVAGTGRATTLLALYAAAFAASHVLADVLGTWGAVVSVAALVAVASWSVADRPASAMRRRASTRPQVPR